MFDWDAIINLCLVVLDHPTKQADQRSPTEPELAWRRCRQRLAELLATSMRGDRTIRAMSISPPRILTCRRPS
jgi:hypothetical protein